MGMRKGQRKKCPQCGMVGHTSPVCHVAARGAFDPDEHDLRAQELVPTLAPGEHVRPGDVRVLVARLLRSGGRA